MLGRRPTSRDYSHMQRALAYVTAYDMGTDENEFAEMAGLLNDEEEPEAMLHSLTQFSWLLLKSLEEAGANKDCVLDWYGKSFARGAEKL